MAPRLDAARIDAWREVSSLFADLSRQIDEDLLEEWDIGLGWFEVLGALQRLGGRARPLAVARELRLPPSSLSRRLDRLADDGWVERHRGTDPDDARAVEVELTRRGRTLWREMNVTFRRSVQLRFAAHLDDEHISAIHDAVVRIEAAAEARRTAQREAEAAEADPLAGYW